MSQFIYFTPREKEAARNADIAEMLMRAGEKLKRSGSEYEWGEGSERVTIRGNLWYHQYEQKGGNAVSFVQRFMDKTYVDAMKYILGNGAGEIVQKELKQSKPKERKAFELPDLSAEAKRAYAYLNVRRGIPKDVLVPFFKKKLIGETKSFHNVAFVYNDNSIDYIAILLTICSMRTISKEFCDLITSSNILDKKDVLKIDAQLTDALYKYCASAYFYEKIQLANLRPVLNNDAFWEALFVCLNAKVGKDELFTIKKIEDELWPVLKEYIKNNNTLKNNVYRLMPSFILNNAVDENLIKILIELLSICLDIEERVYVERDKLINILRKYLAEAKDLTELMFVRGTYSSIYDTEIVSVLKYWAEVDNEFANSLLGNLYKNNKIYLDPYNKLYNIINQP